MNFELEQQHALDSSISFTQLQMTQHCSVDEQAQCSRGNSIVSYEWLQDCRSGVVLFYSTNFS